MPTGSHTGAETSPAKTYILPVAACPITSSCGSGKGGRSTHLPCPRAKNAVRHKQDKPSSLDIRFAPQKQGARRGESRSYHAVTLKVKAMLTRHRPRWMIRHCP